VLIIIVDIFHLQIFGYNNVPTGFNSQHGFSAACWKVKCWSHNSNLPSCWHRWARHSAETNGRIYNKKTLSMTCLCCSAKSVQRSTCDKRHASRWTISSPSGFELSDSLPLKSMWRPLNSSTALMARSIWR